MKSYPLNLVPEIEECAAELASHYNLPNGEWNIGVDAIIYRDGSDGMGWHADDTQGESVVLCVVVESPGVSPRSVRVRPNKKTQSLEHGDEEIQLLDLREGDAYDMDEDMQRGYEHCVPRRKDDKSHRFVLIFRQGLMASISKDSGVALSDLSKLDDNGDDGVEGSSLLSSLSKVRIKPELTFGHHQSVHEAHLYGRRSLFLSGAHRADQVGMNARGDCILLNMQPDQHSVKLISSEA